ncbi:Oidioi.mRNA.OKI2018_I69.PAR.g8526.t1.cds [Oikopleura dioica]|uniref:Oidioi.mRNA.OKI2018_I69.PAR.g8526.t1.cds n=1 Tax=Oikopleura dioica TaxID=34765 RepID=A0ABN7RKN9_OIKDI|nr:Oidioi.mRNA.OKI2018_I69.PAR.g8526.t1.cds [Oikopleura dioica]
MAKIFDLTKSMIEIFNDHAGDDKMLSKEELLKMMAQDKDEMFSSKDISNGLMMMLDEGLDENMSFGEFIEFIAFLCALIEAGQEDNADYTDGPETNYNKPQPEPGTPEWKKMEQEKVMEKIRKILAATFGKKKKKRFADTKFMQVVDSIAKAGM